jgi:rhodanese-related sulfurtransferase
MNNTVIPTINVKSLSALIKNNSNIQLIDVRESYERDMYHIGGLHIPLGSLHDTIHQLDIDKHQPIVVYCKAGGRSMQACHQLIAAGFTDVKNLEGGMLSWIQEIDPE